MKGKCSAKYILMIILISLFTTISYSVYANVNKNVDKDTQKKILIINSYHFDETWEAQIFSGIKEGLSKELKNVEYNFEYLDSKRNALDLNEVKKNFTSKFKNQNYDLIVVCNDEALMVLNQIYDEIFLDTPVVYTSINKQDLKLGENLEEHSVGVREQFLISNAISFVFKTHNDIKTMNFMLDNTVTSKIFAEEIKKLQSKYDNCKFNIIQCDYINEALEKTEGNEKNSVNFMYGVYKDENGQIIDRDTISTIVYYHTKRELYTWSESWLNSVVVGGPIIEGCKIGEITGDLCYRILNNEDVNTMYDISNSSFKYVFYYEALNNFSINMKNLPSNSVVLNHPSVLKKIPMELKATIILIIAILTLLIIILLLRIEYKNKLYKQALEYENLRTEFFANISHELRTPLNIILSTLQLNDMHLKNGEIVYKNDAIYKRMDALKQNSRRLLKLINNLIDITKIDAGYFALQYENINVVEVVEDITMSAANYIERKNINLTFDTEVEEKIGCFDQDKIERVMLNLLSNAIKFTPQGGDIFVNIYDEDKWIKITVKDTGIGIPKDKQQIIFERFRQVENLLTRNQEGSGIGLSLTKSLIEMHDGELEVKSEIGQGSEFIIRLPIKECNRKCIVDKNTINNPQEKINLEFSDIYDD